MIASAILIVEDERIVATDLQLRLARLGYAVPAVAASGERALELVETTRPDLVLMDIHLEGEMNGIEAAHRIHEAYKIPVVFLTAYSEEKTISRARTAHPYGYLLKPFSERELHATIQMAIETRDTSYSRLMAIVDGSNDAIMSKTLEGIITSWNPAAERLFGYSALEAIGKSMTMLFPPDRLDEEVNLLTCIARGENISCYETVRIRKDGSAVNVSVTLSPIRDKFGRIVGASKIAHDITELKQAEQEQRIAATAFDSNEAIMITDTNTVILRVNRAFTKTTGYTSTEIVGKPASSLNSGRHDAAFYAAMWEALNRTGTWQGEILDRRKNGEVFPSWLIITAVNGNDGKVTHYVGILSDITARKAAEDEIKHLAFYDALTELPNRRLLMDKLRHALATSIRTGREGALMFIDMDNFKTLNDTYGHEKGDLLLQEVAQRLKTVVRECDTIARLGGDEFVVVLEELSPNLEEAAVQAQSVGEKILGALNLPYDLVGLSYRNTPSIGVTLFSDHKQSAGELLKRADLAMYQAKSAGRNVLRFFDSEIQAAVLAYTVFEAEFRQAIAKNEFILHFQAQVNGDGYPTGVEALVRWHHPNRGLVPPLEFIPLAEKTGLIIKLGNWVLETACAQLVTWSTQPTMAHFTMAVNVSADQFRRPDYAPSVLAVLDSTGADANKLKLEITESLLLHDIEDIIVKMTALQARGVSFSLDDFGTGYSSLSYLKRLPLDQLKIDQSFVRDVLTDPHDATIAHTIVALAQSLGLEVIAEGVETEEQREFLAEHGCVAYQGFLFCRPLPLSEFEQFIKQKLANA